MTFEGFDAAPLIEGNGFSPSAPDAEMMLIATGDGTLEAALRQMAAPHGGGWHDRAATRAEAADLWVPPAGSQDAQILERTAFARLSLSLGHDGSGRDALQDGANGPPDCGCSHHMKDVVLRAAFNDGDGDGKEDKPIVIVAKRPQNVGTGDETGGGYGDGSYPGLTNVDGDMGSGGNLDGPLTPNCANSNQVEGKTAPDGGKYLAPESITNAYLQSAVDHITQISREQGKIATLRAIYNMYENPSDPNFVDFKDWGSPSGPPGSVGAGNVTYFSTSLGHEVTANAFEAFGNYFFGVICGVGGLSVEETRTIAALAQSGRLNELLDGDLTALVRALINGDDPQDRPFVTDGFTDGQRYHFAPESNGYKFGVKEGSCPNDG